MTDQADTAIRFADLGATVLLGALPAEAADEMPHLYQSAFAVPEYFPVYKHYTVLDACLLEEPRHVVAFLVEGRSVTILNRLWAIDPPSAARCLQAIFRALPHVERAVIQLPFPPSALGLPTAVLERSADIVVTLPETPQTVRSLLSTATRKHTRNYLNRLRRDHPDHRFAVIEGPDISEDLLRIVAGLVRTRLADKGVMPSFTDEYVQRLTPFARRWGLVVALTVDDRIIAADLCSHVGTQAYDHLGSFLPDYSRYEPGWLCVLHAMETVQARGCTHFHLLWGEHEYKYRLGGRPAPLYTAAVYRSRLARLRSVRDWATPLALRPRRAARSLVRKARRVVSAGVGRGGAGRDAQTGRR